MTKRDGSSISKSGALPDVQGRKWCNVRELGGAGRI